MTQTFLCKGLKKDSTPCTKRTTNISQFCFHHRNQYIPIKKVKKYKIKINKKLEKPNDCAICYDNLTEKDKPLECGHYFHMNCIKSMIKAECPICRTPLKKLPKEIKKEIKKREKEYAKEKEEEDFQATLNFIQEELHYLLVTDRRTGEHFYFRLVSDDNNSQ